jgi:hypothetical protein
MKILFIALLVYLANFRENNNTAFGGHKLTIQEAERILGEECQLKESGNEAKDGGHRYKSTHIGNSGSSYALYFMFESYTDESVAKKTFDEFKTSNQSAQGFEMISNIGEEAFFHTDKENFGLIIARKDNEMVRLKVNKLSPKTSINELKKVAADIMART